MSLLAAPVTMGAPIPAKRTAAQRDRWRKRLRWFLRGLSCATGAPGLSQQQKIPEDGDQAEIEGDEETKTHSTAVIQNSPVPTASGGQDKLDKPVPTAHGGQDKVVEREPAACSGQTLTDRTATEKKVRQDAREKVQKLKPKNREPDKMQQHRPLCEPRQTRTPEEDSEKTLAHKNKKVPKSQSGVAEVHPLDYLDFTDIEELGLTCQAWHTSELIFEYLRRWTSSHYSADEDFDDLITSPDKVADSYCA
ncbi:unnamed protein product [Polarella glacialis]|uniref:Uncharacterized protein n=1 Tax=Polarella glacialis TaxID=89957 RepID=A0A813IA90_POLGL|nr:unnamed protein product [Polarella glacialis]